jgi:uncharacterized cupin superfamily protein
MSDHTIRNLREVENMAPKFGYDGEARFASRDLGLAQVGLSYQRLEPGARQPFGHRHDEQEEVYVVVDGSGRVRLGDDVSELRTWDAVRVAPGVMRCFEAGGEGLTLLAIGAHGLAPDDRGEIVHGWWSE